MCMYARVRMLAVSLTGRRCGSALASVVAPNINNDSFRIRSDCLTFSTFIIIKLCAVIDAKDES